MNKKQKLEVLKKKLLDLKESNRLMWDSYGSELCAGAMINEEEKLEREIEKLEKE